MWKTYLSLTKPGIIMGNLIAATGGFFLASQGHPDWLLFVASMTGISLVIASGCIYNNLYDRDIDGRMARTQSRALVTGSINPRHATALATLLGVMGFALLWWYTNVSTFLLAVLGFFAYVVLYTMIYKRKNIHGTLVGSISGATPPMMGYTSVTGHVDAAALLIFAAFSAWQMPHTYAIAVFREQDYRASRIPLLPLIKGLNATQRYNSFYIMVFIGCVLALAGLGYTSWLTSGLITAVASYWLYRNIADYQPDEASFDASQWGKRLFIISILVIMLFSLLISLDFLPQRYLVHPEKVILDFFR